MISYQFHSDGEDFDPLGRGLTLIFSLYVPACQKPFKKVGDVEEKAVNLRTFVKITGDGHFRIC